MITLLPNSSDEQSIYLTLQEMKKDFPAFTDYLVIFTNMASKDTLSMIGNVDADNARYRTIHLRCIWSELNYEPRSHRFERSGFD